jgi:hypothetical protein
VTLRLYIHKPKVVFRARFNTQGQTWTYPQEFIDYDNVTLGNTTLLKESMTVLVGSAPDLYDYGIVRFRYVDPDYPTLRLRVSHYSRGTAIGDLTIVDNSYITILEDYRIWAKIPQMAGGAVWKDTDIGPYENNGKPAAVPNGGPGTAGDIDPTTGMLEVAFSAKSFIFDLAFTPPVPNPQNYIWEWPGSATVVSGSYDSPDITVRFLPGFYYMYLTVHNWGLNHAETQKIPIFARDPANDLSISQFRIVSHTQDKIGQEVTIELHKSLPRTSYYDGFLAMIWDDSITYVPSLRRHMQFIGWHQSDEVAIRAEPTATLDDTKLRLLDAGKRLELIPGFSQVIEYYGGPDTFLAWDKTRFGNMLYYMWFLLHFHTTVLEVADFLDYTHSLSVYKFIVLGSERQSVSAQIQELAAKLSPDYRMSCTRQGQLKMVPDLSLMHTAARPTTVMDTIADSSWTSLTWEYSYAPTVGQIQTMALISTNDYVIVNGKEELEVIACVAPGTGYGQGEQFIEAGQRIADGQFDLNNVEGNRYAKLNAKFKPCTITVPWELLDPDVDVAEAKWLNLTISDENHPVRDTTGHPQLRGVVTEMGTEYEYADTGLLRTVTLHWEMETSGFPAQTVTLWPNNPAEETT